MRSNQRRFDGPRTIDLVVDGDALSVTLRRSSRARRYTLRLIPTGEFVLTVPAGGSVEKAVRFAEAHSGWIRQRLARLQQHVHFEDGAVLPLRGKPHEIRHAGNRRGHVRIVSGGGGENPVLAVPGEPEFLARRLSDWLRGQARSDLQASVDCHAAAAGVRVRRMTVRDQISRWGSCSASGALSFSWRLVMAPPHVLDYLAAHEVAHLVEMNHGPRFWRLLRRLAPHTDAAEAWLKRHGPGLHRYGLR